VTCSDEEKCSALGLRIDSAILTKVDSFGPQRPHLQDSLREEEQMAKWIDANVEKVTLAYLNREVRAAA
jgi:hypothetical protein